VPISNRSTAAWATDGVSPTADTQKDDGQAFGGRIKPSSEPAFAGRVRVAPGDESAFNTGKVTLEDDDDLLPQRRGSRSGTLLLVMALLVMGVAAGVVYVFVIKKSKTDDTTAKAPTDAAVVAVATDAAIVTPIVTDATVDVAPPLSPVDLARAELGPDLELKLRDALKSLDGKTDPGVEAMRAHLAAQIAQGLYDRAIITGDKSDAEKLKKDAKTIVIEAATSAQRAFKATPDDPAANLAMAEVLRLQDKPIKDVKRYLDTAKAKQTDDWKRDIALAGALTMVRDKKLDDAKTAFAAIDSGEDKLETSGDVRARFHLALVTYAQNKPADAKPLVEQILAAQPEHAGAKALAARIENTVSKGDPLPPEEGSGAGSAKTNVPTGSGPGPSVGAGDTYDSILAKANKLAESNCARASELYAKALEQKPNGVEALTGMGYCHIDAKQFASAFSKFRAALAISSRYEPALWGVAEAYTQQGRKEQALEAVKAYLEVYPGAPKGVKALDRLGGGAVVPTPPEKPPEGGSGATPPAPTPTTTPETGAGSGSG
jgi:outer membrane protein assembly factor BamD (BamD/ComL family)